MKHVPFLFAALMLLTAMSAGAQGSLTPPGPPAPTMKTLDQIEPRTPIASLPFSITHAGSYYVTTNLSVAAGDGITILAGNVTLDLTGFTLQGGSNTGSGILVSGFQTNITIRNGTVRGWPGNGINSISARTSEYEGIRAITNGSDGLFLGVGAGVRQCTARYNRLSGMLIQSGTVIDCVASDNSINGIWVVEDSVVTGCTAYRNGNSGIEAQRRSVITSCTANDNGGGIGVGVGSIIKSCVASGNLLNGFGLSEATITDSTAYGNRGDGISVSHWCVVRDNTVRDNGDQVPFRGGIHATGARNRIEGNQIMANRGDGIIVDDNANARRNVIIKNTVGANSLFQFRVPGVPGQGAAGDNLVPVTTDISTGTPNPWTNISP